MNHKVIETQDLTVYYGKHRGISNISLTVEKAEVFGFLGPNGAGKTTTQRVLLDVIHPTSGHASIFGLDCQTQGVEVRKRIGYLPGELSLYEGMKGYQFLALMASLRENSVDEKYRQELYERLDFDPSRKIKQYSRGNKQKVGIIAACMGKPELLVLDEPTSGLDPLIQQVVMELVLEAKEDGRTVFFSSHILPEVQQVCDRVGIIRNGELIKTERVETLTQQQFKRLQLTLKQSPPQNAFAMAGVTEIEREGTTVKLEVREGLDKVMEKAVTFGIDDIETLPLTLEEVFLEFYGHHTANGQHQNGGKHYA